MDSCLESVFLASVTQEFREKRFLGNRPESEPAVEQGSEKLKQLPKGTFEWP